LIRLIPFAAAFTVVTSASYASGMVCKNPGREYLLVYEQGDKAAVMNPDSDNAKWMVLATLFDDRKHVVVVDLGQPGMAGLVHLRPYRKVEIFSNGKLVQTDGCQL